MTWQLFNYRNVFIKIHTVELFVFTRKCSLLSILLMILLSVFDNHIRGWIEIKDSTFTKGWKIKLTFMQLNTSLQKDQTYLMDSWWNLVVWGSHCFFLQFFLFFFFSVLTFVTIIEGLKLHSFLKKQIVCVSYPELGRGWKNLYSSPPQRKS